MVQKVVNNTDEEDQEKPHIALKGLYHNLRLEMSDKFQRTSAILFSICRYSC